MQREQTPVEAMWNTIITVVKRSKSFEEFREDLLRMDEFRKKMKLDNEKFFLKQLKKTREERD